MNKYDSAIELYSAAIDLNFATNIIFAMQAEMLSAIELYSTAIN